ncbi:MAG: hypothetical protein CMJ83_19220 [Planctomycetes bacterium]|nr:hypothetical protein [Planctomycetota bacterium]
MTAESEEKRRHRETVHLARDAQSGGQASFGALYERLTPVLHSWASLRLRPGMRGRVEPDDIVQEVWMRAHRVFDRWDSSRSPFRAWLLSVAKNVMLEALRHVRRPDAAAGGVTQSSKAFDLADVPADVTSLSRRCARDERLLGFVECVRELPAGDRMLVVHCGLEGDTCKNVAVRLDLTEAAVIKRWQRLKKRLEGMGVPGLLSDEES